MIAAVKLPAYYACLPCRYCIAVRGGDPKCALLRPCVKRCERYEALAGRHHLQGKA